VVVLKKKYFTAESVEIRRGFYFYSACGAIKNNRFSFAYLCALCGKSFLNKAYNYQPDFVALNQRKT